MDQQLHKNSSTTNKPAPAIIGVPAISQPLPTKFRASKRVFSSNILRLRCEMTPQLDDDESICAQRRVLAEHELALREPEIETRFR
jgi:hypothetical protein